MLGKLSLAAGVRLIPKRLFRGLSLRTKLLLSFLGLLAVFAAASYFQSQNLLLFREQIARQSQASEQAALALALKQEMSELSSILYGAMVSRKAGEPEAYEAVKARFLQHVEQIGELASTPEQRKARATLNTIAGEFVQIVDQVRADAMRPEITAQDWQSRTSGLYEQTLAHQSYTYEVADLFYVSFREDADRSAGETVTLLSDTLRASYVSIVVTACAAAALSWMLIRTFMRPIRRLQHEMALIAEGDLTRRIGSDAADELGRLSRHFDQMTEKVRLMLARSREIASGMSEQSQNLGRISAVTAAAGGDMLKAIRDISTGTDRQAALSERMAAMASEVESEISEIAGIAGAIKQLSEEAAGDTKTGSEAVASLLETAERADAVFRTVEAAMARLAEDSAQIDKIVRSITEIATRTNVLALNASIEAARAGEYGKGFSVIAGEVRQLSAQTNNEARSIGRIIGTVHTRMADMQKQLALALEAAVAQTDRAGETRGAFVAIDRSMNGLTGEIERIYAKVEETRFSNERLVQSVRQVSAAAEATAAGGEEVAASAVEQHDAMRALAEQADETYRMAQSLHAEIGRFRTGEDGAENGASDGEESGAVGDAGNEPGIKVSGHGADEAKDGSGRAIVRGGTGAAGAKSGEDSASGTAGARSGEGSTSGTASLVG